MEEVLRQIRWRGSVRGQVRSLAAFNKKFHSVPDAVNPATEAFLAKLVAQELEAEAEDFFQRTRAALQYKRKEISLSAEGGRAVLEARDFALEWFYALAADAPETWVRTLTLSGVGRRDVLENPAFDALFAGLFSTLEFQLAAPLQVEAVIDAVEAANNANAAARDAGTGARSAVFVEYPSNCATCTLHVEGTDVSAIFSGDALQMEFPKPGSPRELADEFTRIRHAFDILGVKVATPAPEKEAL